MAENPWLTYVSLYDPSVIYEARLTEAGYELRYPGETEILAVAPVPGFLATYQLQEE